MKTHLVTFTDERMTISASKLVHSAIQHGCDSYSIWTERDLPEWLYRVHPEMVEGSRGFGWYAWKPFIVCEEVLKAEDGDIIIYADAGQTLVNSVQHVIKEMDSDVFLFSNGWNHIDWCKMDVATAICPTDSSHLDINTTYITSELKQVQASLIFFRVSKESKEFVKEWLAWSLMPGLIDNSPSKLPNYRTFQEHRWDQAILGSMAIKYGLKLHWLPYQYAQHLDKGEDRYPYICEHHRRRDVDWQALN